MPRSLTFEALRQYYVTFPPLRFRETGPEYHNTCAVRLADAITRVVPDFFDSFDVATWSEKGPTGRYIPSAEPRVGMKFAPAPVGRRLPIRANEIADCLNGKLDRGQLTNSRAQIMGRRGIVYFQGIPGYLGSGHISLWDGSEILDRGEYWDSIRIFFWPL